MTTLSPKQVAEMILRLPDPIAELAPVLAQYMPTGNEPVEDQAYLLATRRVKALQFMGNFLARQPLTIAVKTEPWKDILCVGCARRKVEQLDVTIYRFQQPYVLRLAVNLHGDIEVLSPHYKGTHTLIIEAEQLHSMLIHDQWGGARAEYLIEVLTAKEIAPTVPRGGGL